jgi:hypothetical protein
MGPARVPNASRRLTHKESNVNPWLWAILWYFIGSFFGFGQVMGLLQGARRPAMAS